MSPLPMCSSCGGYFLAPRRAPMWPMCPACSAEITHGYDPWNDPGADWSAYTVQYEDDEPEEEDDRMLEGMAVIVMQKHRPSRVFRLKSEFRDFEASHKLRYLYTENVRLSDGRALADYYEVVE